VVLYFSNAFRTWATPNRTCHIIDLDLDLDLRVKANF